MRLSDKIVLLLFCLYIILKPFYFWSSGLPQISDGILLLLIIFYIIKNKFRISFFKESKIFIYISLGFVLYVLFINIVWSLILNGEFEFFKTSAFYIYNLLASLLVLTLYHEYHDFFYKHMYASLLISTLIQLAIYLLSGRFDGTRTLVFFNNPNQLGYHNLLVLGFLILISQRQKTSPWWFISSIGAALILCFSSLSKAAIFSCLALLAFFLFIKVITKKFDKRAIIYLTVIIVILSIKYHYNREVVTSNQLYKSVVYRISRIGLDGDDNFNGRGYDRLVKYSQYLLFGAGEGDYSRFGYDIEIHSTLGNILMSYGIIGLLLFVTMIILAIQSNKWRDSYIIFFIFLYGLTHNGIRNTLLWILVALISINMSSVKVEKVNLIEILLVIRKRLWAISIITIICVLASGFTSYYILEPEYQTYTTLIIVRPREYKQKIEYADVLLNKKLVTTYGEIIKSRVVADEFMYKLGLKFTDKELHKKIDVMLVKDTEIIKISVKDIDGKAAAQIANEIADVFIKYIVKIMKIKNIEIIDRAEVPLKSYKPKPLINMLLTSFLGIILGIFYAFIHEHFDNTIKISEDIDNNLGLPVIGIIPKAT